MSVRSCGCGGIAWRRWRRAAWRACVARRRGAAGRGCCWAAVKAQGGLASPSCLLRRAVLLVFLVLLLLLLVFIILLLLFALVVSVGGCAAIMWAFGARHWRLLRDRIHGLSTHDERKCACVCVSQSIQTFGEASPADLCSSSSITVI